MLKICFQGFVWLCVLLAFLWAAGAIYFLQWLPGWIRLLCCGFYVIGLLIWISKSKDRKKGRAILAGSTLVIYLLTLLTAPSNNRIWARDQTRVATVEISDGSVTIDNFRNFHYRSASDFDVNFEKRTFQLTDIDSLSLIVQKFTASEGLAHVMLSFGGDLPPSKRKYFGLSVEVRREEGEVYSPLKGVYRNFELTHVIGDERDLIGVRTVHRPGDRVWMYKLNATPLQIQQLFLRFAKRIKRLETDPEFYHTFLNNCANGITRQTYELTPAPINWLDPRIVLPGYSDQFAFENGLIDSSEGRSFEQVKRDARIDIRAREAGITEDFSVAIRRRQLD